MCAQQKEMFVAAYTRENTEFRRLKRLRHRDERIGGIYNSVFYSKKHALVKHTVFLFLI